MNPVEILIEYIFGKYLKELTEAGNTESLSLTESLIDEFRETLAYEREEHSDLTDEQFVNMWIADCSQYDQERTEEAKMLLAGKQIPQDEFEVWKFHIMLARRRLERIERESHPQASEIEVQSVALQRLAALIDAGELPPIDDYIYSQSQAGKLSA